MLFFPQTGLSKDRSLFFRIIIVSIVVHATMVLSLFLSDVFFSTRLLLTGKGARVSIGGQRASGAIQQDASAHGMLVPRATDTQSAQNAVPKLETPEPKVAQKIQAEPLPDKSPAKQKKEKASPKQEGLPVKKKQEKQVIKKDVQQEQTPTYSELPKKYTTLKKKEKQVEKKNEQVQSSPKSTASEASLVNNHQNVQGSGSSAIGGSVGTGSAERLEFMAEEAGGSDNIIIQEIERHYRRPPGFDDHEPFTFIFEIHEGKAIVLSQKGSEPLVLYSAIKDAVLKGSFKVMKQRKRIELIIKGS